ncbi:hypothetical protein BDBG_01434 [Blastomyces gilchristii SLH14081]|uniref:Uncharacterized protein n=1 Tax=Blastomyces gilchristii (strain SLH14081) TaxID=559298 RepID=A0A179UD36_BLAGS|nr:uncharacterized protein BDBG_01434 [Blastomyces gilchristii SLH14081]OAT04961.1 hypothetical protein BDBG_01434 [Blastomyces gilchristii SLH14081]
MASTSYTTPAAHSHASGPWDTSARSATDPLKDEVKLQFGGGVCWLCEGPYPSLIQVEVAHNVHASIEATVAHRWQAMGILPQVFYRAHLKHMMRLCITCHGYDDPYPIWAILPETGNELVSIPQAVPRISTDSSFEGASRLPFPPMVREPIVEDHELIIDAGMPPEVRNQINDLMQLGSRPDPTPRRRRQKEVKY